MIRIAFGIAFGLALGLAVGPLAESAMALYFPAQPYMLHRYARACLADDHCVMIIEPKGQPHLRVTCTLTVPARCEDGVRP